MEALDARIGGVQSEPGGFGRSASEPRRVGIFLPAAQAPYTEQEIDLLVRVVMPRERSRRCYPLRERGHSGKGRPRKLHGCLSGNGQPHAL